jgi:hypothetical protein
MSDIHVIAGNGAGEWSVVFHFDVPDVNNAAGVNVRTALLRSGLIAQHGEPPSVSVLPDGDGTGGTIETAEKDKIAAGEVYEHVERLTLNGVGMTNPLRTTLLRERYAALDSENLSVLQDRLNFFGVTLARS